MSGFDDRQSGDKKQDVEQDVEIDKQSVGAEAQKAREYHDKRRRYILGIATSGIFIALMIVSAFISIPITPSVAFTLQCLVTNTCCLLLGKKWGACSVVLYVVLGLLGLPIFSAGGGGFAYVLKPSFGFLIGMAVGGFFAAWFREKTGKTNFTTYLFASLIDMVIWDIIGVAYGAGIMYGYMRVTTGVWDFLMMMLIPFIPIDIAKCVISALLCPRLSKYCKLDSKNH